MSDEWISIKDELPPMGIPCLLYKTYPEGTIFNCRADPLRKCAYVLGGLVWGGDFVSYEDQHTKLKYISHWMPLPKPPTFI